MSSVQDDDSLHLVIQPAGPQKKSDKKPILLSQTKHHKPIFAMELKLNVSRNRLDLYFTVNKIYLQNLIQRKQKPACFRDQHVRNTIGNNCIIYQQFQINPESARELMDIDYKIKGNIHVTSNPNTNTQFKVYFNNKQLKRQEDHMWALLHYSSAGIWKSKNISMNEQKKDKSIYYCGISNQDLNDYMSEHYLLMNITLKRKQTSIKSHLGIINLGNTCFMNTSLQLLFYLKPLRKIILQSKSKSKIITQLKDVFQRLYDVEEGHPIDVEDFINSYEKFNQQPRMQQDVQQFLLDFIDVIQTQCPQAKHLWQGQCTQQTHSKQVDKPYKSKQIQSFSQLDVHMIDGNGNYYKSIQQSLQYLMHEEAVQDLIQNDEFGKIMVSKKKTFQTLPDIMFINLKRYEWNKQKLRLSKILGHIEYNQQMNLGFLIGTPGGQDKNPQSEYTLYSVIVHKGSSPHNGHYFVFINTSTDCQNPEWLQFNDSLVRNSDLKQILSFTGKKSKLISLDKDLGIFTQKYVQSDASSYLLVYIRKQQFNDYQNITTTLSKQYLKQKLKKKGQKQKQNIQQVNLLCLESYDTRIDLFGNDLEFTQVPLDKDEGVIKQMQKVQKQYFGIKSQIMFCVNTNDKKMTFIQDNYILQDIKKSHIRGHREMNYILLISSACKKITKGNRTRMDKMGIVSVIKNELQEQINIDKLSLINPQGLQQLQQTVRRSSGYVNYQQSNSKQEFIYGWNKYLQISIIKIQEINQQTVSLDLQI